MVETLRPQHLILPVAPLAAGVIGVLTAAMFAVLPTDLVESMVVDSGIAAILPAAEPPLGLTARLLLVLVFGGGVGVLAWFGLFLVFGTRTIALHRARAAGDETLVKAPVLPPVLRRADSHPDAPARRPLFANTDLGTPFLEVRARSAQDKAASVSPEPKPEAATFAEAAPVVAQARPQPPLVGKPLPTDLDQPLAAFDPAAVPDTPLDWFPRPAQPESEPEPEPEPVRSQTFDPGERFETFALTPMVRPAPRAVPDMPPETDRATDPADTIHALLDRLERVVASRRAPEAQTEAQPAAKPKAQPKVQRAEAAPASIESTLVTLRRMATERR